MSEGENKPCGLDYYQVRNGECKHGETGGHNGEIICGVCKPHNEPSQDELWEEFERTCLARDFTFLINDQEVLNGPIYLDMSEAKKRYRITRI